MPASSFPAYVTQGYEPVDVEEFTPGTSSDAFVVGSLVYYDTATALMKLCGADPALIAGIAEGSSVTGALLTPNGKVPVRLLKGSMIVAMASATAYVEATHRGNVYGVVNTSGKWLVDISDTSNTRVIVVDGDPGQNIFFVKFLAANLQFDAVAS